ncbi:unnamed protein product [Mytilus coruscus]|uniref:Uncharacterized protein n=1 Tax=Mytilus coruscus TaxID=42192 RepID=A0A6J8EH35_MYTCO|nr:unnamed protein product [Mytilus coruscus]
MPTIHPTTLFNKKFESSSLILVLEYDMCKFAQKHHLFLHGKESAMSDTARKSSAHGSTTQNNDTPFSSLEEYKSPCFRNKTKMEKDKEHTVYIINEGDGMDSVQVWQAYTMCATSIMLMFAICSVVTKFGKPKTLKEGVSLWKWRNILISWIHAVVVGIWDFLWQVLIFVEKTVLICLILINSGRMLLS